MAFLSFAALAATATVAMAGSARIAGETRKVPPSLADKEWVDFDTILQKGRTTLKVEGSVAAIYRHSRIVYDAFYCYDGCGDTPREGGGLFAGRVGGGDPTNIDNFMPRKHPSDRYGDPPPYSKSHVYTVAFDCTAGVDLECGRLRLDAEPHANPDPAAHYVGFYEATVTVGDAPTNLVVDFNVIAKGRSNIDNVKEPSGLVTASLVGSGNATFTKTKGNLLVATATKGHLVLQEVYPGGKTTRLELGVVSVPKALEGVLRGVAGTVYSRDTQRLALLLKVEGSNDPDCPEASLLPPEPPRFLYLTLHGGDGTFALLHGLLVPKGQVLAASCPGHFHGWQRGSRAQAYVSVRERPSG